jgi:MoaA/NifB/PqqE/SkfB family radical SAM enzyme
MINLPILLYVTITPLCPLDCACYVAARKLKSKTILKQVYVSTNETVIEKQ